MLKKADEVLYYAVKGIADLITVHGLINLDFADVKAVMSQSGLALMGTGMASGEARAKEAAMRAITSPLLEDVSIQGAKGVLININCAPDMTIEEVSEAADTIYKEADENAQIFFGTVSDPDAGDEMRITVIATGISQAGKQGLPNGRHVQEHLSLLNGGSKAKAAGEGKRRRGQQLVLQSDLDRPTYLRLNPEGKDQEPAAAQARRAVAGPGQEEFIFEEDDLDVPAYIRKKAD